MEHQPIKNTPGFSRLESQLRSKLAVAGKRLLAGLPFGDRIPAVKAQAEKDFNDRFDKWYNGLSDERKERYHQLFETESSIYDPVQRDNAVYREFSDMPGGPVEQIRTSALLFAAGGGLGATAARSASFAAGRGLGGVAAKSASSAAGGGLGGVAAKSASRLPRAYKALGRPPVKVPSNDANPLNQYMYNLRLTRPYRIRSSKLIESEASQRATREALSRELDAVRSEGRLKGAAYNAKVGRLQKEINKVSQEEAAFSAKFSTEMADYDKMWEALAEERAAARAWVDQQHKWQSTIYPVVGKGAKSVGKTVKAVAKGIPGFAGAATHKIGGPSRWLASKLFPLDPASSTFTAPDLFWASTTLGTVFGGGGYALASLKDQAIDSDVTASKPEVTPIPGDQKVASNLVFQAYKDLSATGDTNTFMKTMQTVQGTDAEKSIMQRARSNFFQTQYPGATLDLLEGAVLQTADPELRDKFSKDLDSFNKQFEGLPPIEKYMLGGY